MSTKERKPAERKRGRPEVKIKKTRTNFTFDPAILKKAQRQAFKEGSALSPWLERLVREKLAATEPPSA